MTAASCFIDSDLKTEDVKAKCNKAILNLFCSIRVVIKKKQSVQSRQPGDSRQEKRSGG